MMHQIRRSWKAIAAAIGAAVTAAAPAVIDVIADQVTVVLGSLVTGAVTWLARNAR